MSRNANGIASFSRMSLYLGILAILLAVVTWINCACGQNVTIIELKPKLSRPSTEDCIQCTKSFCLEAQPDFCSGAGANDDLTAFCFQRDSYKDESIIYLFLFITIGLLVFACTRPFLEQFLRHRRLWTR
ncbi:hypothetical protein BDF22DRAFT_742151 [Syncephalis plumigaleata]|nr:hypothetical protein BDF22DRAFT_742151 [Syncephalis plumigaleata]